VKVCYISQGDEKLSLPPLDRGDTVGLTWLIRVKCFSTNLLDPI